MLNKDTLKVFAKKNTLLTRLCLFIAVSLMVLFLSQLGKNVIGAYREDAILLKLIKATGAEFTSVSVTGWVRVDEKVPGANDPEALVNQVTAQLGLLEEGRKTENWQNKLARGVKVEGKTPEGTVFSVLGQTLATPEGKNVAHVMVSTAGAENGKVRYFKQKLHKALDGNGGEGNVAVTYSGKIENELNGEDLLADAEKIMALAGAPVQEKTVKDNLVSLTGFSPRIFNDMSYAGKEVNLNVALRSNPAEHVTYVYVASPVIFTEY